MYVSLLILVLVCFCMVYVLQDVLVVCRDSDMEFWADISDDDSDKELDAVRIYER